MARTEHSWRNIATDILQSTAGQWVMILSLIFGGCCSNAWTLELATSQNPHSGTLITFAQFFIVTVLGLRSMVTSYPPKKPRTVNVDELAKEVIDAIAELWNRRSNNSNSPTNLSVGIQATQDTRDLPTNVVNRLTRAHLPVMLIGATDDPHPQEGGRITITAGDDVLNLQGAHWDYSVLCVEDPSAPRPSASLLVDTSLPSELVILSPPRDRSRSAPLWARFRWKRPRIPIRVWLIQVALYFLTSLLNNLALGYNVNLAVHIIFRSGGLAANLVVGWFAGKKYTRTQVISVLLVTAGVGAATLSAKLPSKNKKGDFHTTSFDFNARSYAIGIALLTIALILSAVMGLAQERAYSKYGRHWEEGLFYLHALSLPMFAFVGQDLVSQIRIANASPPVEISAVSLLQQSPATITSAFVLPTSPFIPQPYLYPFAGKHTQWVLENALLWLDRLPRFSIPQFWIPLALNVLTQLICVSGVHRLTSRVSSLTVTLVLVVRKAVSLGISVVLIQGSKGNAWLWGGAAAVLLGTMLYSTDSTWQKRSHETKQGQKAEKKEE